MGAVCENIARRSNAEDGCKGRFWETRFASRNLCDEPAILVCGVYVDLNPIRAGLASTPETSRYSSAADRIAGLLARRGGEAAAAPDRWLCELTLSEDEDTLEGPGERPPTSYRASNQGLLHISREAYLALLDWTGRQVREGKRGAIPAHLGPILERLHIRAENWLECVSRFDQRFGSVVGRSQELTEAAKRMGRRWLRGRSAARASFT